MKKSIPIPIRTLDLVLAAHVGTERGWLRKHWVCACGQSYPCEVVRDITAAFRNTPTLEGNLYVGLSTGKLATHAGVLFGESEPTVADYARTPLSGLGTATFPAHVVDWNNPDVCLFVATRVEGGDILFWQILSLQPQWVEAGDEIELALSPELLGVLSAWRTLNTEPLIA